MNTKAVPPTAKRVQKHTAADINRAIRRKTVLYIRKYNKASYEELTRRLHELNREWDTERMLETSASTLILAGSIIGIAAKKPGWFILSGLVGAFLLEHAVQGWCPPLEIIRRLGVRTAGEINNEMIAIKYLRGDFSGEVKHPGKILKMAAKR